VAKIGLHRKWRDDPGLLDLVRGLFTYGPGDDRATGYLYAQGEQPWPAGFAEGGPVLLADLDTLLAVRFEVVAFQAYRNGSGCDWHADGAFDAQAVLSLGTTRTFGVRRSGAEPVWMQVEHGDLVVMPSGFQAEWQHCVPVEDVPGERVSLVFRTVARS
jgi:alkylated DNA repair dioxygenase AlkB